MTTLTPRRSALYMPGSNLRALAKATSLDADCVIIDLEDAVAPDKKDLARHQAAQALKSDDWGHREVVVRVNGLGTPWGAADLNAIAAAQPDAILVPKVSTPSDINTVEEHLISRSAAAAIQLWAMIETPAGVLNVAEIAAMAVSTSLTCLVLGTNDLAKETGARLLPGRSAMMPWIMGVLLAARAHGLTALDGVFNDLSDEAGFAAECEQGANCGFDGKTVIHPKQLRIANKAFAPTEDEVAKANDCLLYTSPSPRDA